MASALHHGAPGSFKTFTLVQRRAIDALKEGRIVVTNIRGFEDVELVRRAFPEIDFPYNATIHYMDTDILDNRKFMALWYLWCPVGALILIDEVQRIYRSKDKVQDLTAQNFPEIYHDELINGRQRPDNFYDAFDMQRHFNWDVYMSSTNIAKVRPEIREVCEWAYRHRNISGVLPWKKNCWYEHQHDPEQSGKIASHRVGEPIEYRADPRIFKCYQSTATGDHINSKAGRSIFSDPKILSTFGAAIVLGLVSVGLVVYKQTKNETPKPVTSDLSASSTPSAEIYSQPAAKSGNSNNNHAPNFNVNKTGFDDTDPLATKKIHISGRFYMSSDKGYQNYYILAVKNADGTIYRETTDTIRKIGFKVVEISDCLFYYTTPNQARRYVSCGEFEHDNHLDAKKVDIALLGGSTVKKNDL